MSVLPRMIPVRQKFPDRSVADIPAAVMREMAAGELESGLKPGARIAIGVGSRGIANLAEIVRATVDFWKSRGCKPFIFPAMGSHGAATAEGQADVLAHYGIRESTAGCPIVSRLEVVSLGKSDDGIEAFMDQQAFESDGVFLVNRVKWHTDFSGKLESGLFKMMAIGLGKFAGAQRYHTYAYNIGLEVMIRGVGRRVLSSGKILGGLAIVEDAHHSTARLFAVNAAHMERKEEEILALAKSWMGRIPFPLDILVIDEIGKNYSGAGMDTKVVNRGIDGEYNPWDTAPRIERIYVRGLSELSYGNGVGLGMADVIHARLLRAINWHPTHINSLTSGRPAAIRTPISFSTDRECLDKIAPTVGKLDLSQVTLGWIRSSLDIATLALSENLLGQIESAPGLEILGAPHALPFNAAGDLPDLSAFIAVKEPAYAAH